MGAHNSKGLEGAALDGQPFLNITALHALGAGGDDSTYSSSPMPGSMRSWHGVGLESVIFLIAKASPLKGDVLIECVL